jgi:hypothetical protein
MKAKKIPVLQGGLILAFVLAACGSPPTAKPTIPAPTSASEQTDTNHHFVTNSLLIPTTSEQSQAWALDIDQDSQNSPDNLFGNMLAMLVSFSPEMDLQTSLNEMISTGQVVMLHSLKAGDLQNDAEAQWTLFHGMKTESAPLFDGTDNFTIDPGTQIDSSTLNGSITNGHFAGGPAVAGIQMAFMGIPVEVELIGVRIEADVSVNGCTNGKLGGGLTEQQFQAGFLPALVDGLNQTIAANTGSTLAQTMLAAFDADQNGTISSTELENNILFKAAVSPDLDLLDASGQFNPNQDGVKDSLSVGLGFTCVPANFTAPGE